MSAAVHFFLCTTCPFDISFPNLLKSLASVSTSAPSRHRRLSTPESSDSQCTVRANSKLNVSNWSPAFVSSRSARRRHIFSTQATSIREHTSVLEHNLLLAEAICRSISLLGFYSHSLSTHKTTVAERPRIERLGGVSWVFDTLPPYVLPFHLFGTHTS